MHWHVHQSAWVLASSLAFSLVILVCKSAVTGSGTSHHGISTQDPTRCLHIAVQLLAISSGVVVQLVQVAAYSAINLLTCLACCTAMAPQAGEQRVLLSCRFGDLNIKEPDWLNSNMCISSKPVVYLIKFKDKL